MQPSPEVEPLERQVFYETRAFFVLLSTLLIIMFAHSLLSGDYWGAFICLLPGGPLIFMIAMLYAGLRLRWLRKYGSCQVME